MNGEAGKGDARRPCALTREAEELQWNLAFGNISREEYDKKRTELVSQLKWWK